MRLRILTDDAANGGAANGGAAKKDAPATNGHASNGSATNGHAANGVSTNGHGANGHATNGVTAKNGAATNGHYTTAVATNGAAANGAATKNGAAKNGLQAKKNGARTHRPGTNGAATVQPAVKLSGVTKSFGRTAVLRDINLSVAPGELIEVTGPSGSGKTTLLRLVHGQLRPNSGEVWVRGRGLHRWWRRGLGRIRRNVAFIFQEHHLLPRLTALENLTLALQVTDPQLPFKTIKRRALETLETLGLVHRRNAYPHQLSAGERQRVAVGRALITRPRVILADEPMASIDDDNAHIVQRLLEDAAAAGTAVIVATHRHSFPSSRILRLPGGTVHLNGSKKAVSNGNGTHSAPPLWRLLLPIPVHERPHHKQAAAPKPLPLWRRLVASTANSYRLVFLSGLRSWSRDLRLTAPALGSMALLLLLCGTLAMVGIAIERVAAQQTAQASLVRIYLASDSTPDAVAALKARLTSDPRVTSVTDVSPEQALAEASSRPGLDNLASLSATNPFPASLDVHVRLVTQLGAVVASVKNDPAIDPTYPTSYDPDTYSRLRRVALTVGAIGGGLLLLFGLVAYAVIANSMRGIATARRQEVAVIQLLGARGWMVRGPFVVEGLMTGALAGALAAAFVAGAWLLATRFESATYAQVLPGVDATAMQYLVAAVIAAGLVLGSLTAMLGFRKVRA
ncbi:MAG TPA: permease-like cell division protein FtsX [Candidatus Dormibacteraeota bacterium]|nr:permease-like cell division protein FtsX [Candidatus Dormibacteraeota bacterium]